MSASLAEHVASVAKADDDEPQVEVPKSDIANLAHASLTSEVPLLD